MKTIIELSKGSFSEEEYADIVMCLNTLFAIRAGEQPLDRELGLDDTDIIGLPAQQAVNMYMLEANEKVKKYEPRVQVDSVEIEADGSGSLEAKIKFKGAEE